jgi:23S rRNA (cytidine1920-2'-O)/16S rRNA (cytidine1409-2'-O)-methyltransferase
MERVNARYLDVLPEPVDVITADVSFISLKLVLPALRRLAADGAPVVTLIKPQFEAGREAVGKGGVVRDPRAHERVLRDLRDWGAANNERLAGVDYSPIRGPAGNIEFLGLWLPGHGEGVSAEVIHSLVQTAHGGLAY